MNKIKGFPRLNRIHYRKMKKVTTECFKRILTGFRNFASVSNVIYARMCVMYFEIITKKMDLLGQDS